MNAELDDAQVATWWHDQALRDGLPDQLTPAELSRVIALAHLGGDGAGPEDGEAGI